MVVLIVSAVVPCMCVLCPQAAHTQEALEESVQMMKEAVDDLAATLAEAASAAGAVGGMVNSITQAINKMEDGPGFEPEGTFVDYQTTMVKTAKAIAVTVQEMVKSSAAKVTCRIGNCGKSRYDWWANSSKYNTSMH